MLACENLNSAEISLLRSVEKYRHTIIVCIISKFIKLEGATFQLNDIIYDI